MREIQKRVADLPSTTAIVYSAIYSDGDGNYFPPADSLALVARTAIRPIVVAAETFVGRGGIGGQILIPAGIGREAAESALRSLDGQQLHPTAEIEHAVRPVFDWRQLQRWGVPESRLPPGSEIRFRDPSVWDQYRAQILLVCAAFLLQTWLIALLVFEHRRRNLAEAQARQTMAELTYMNRTASAGLLSASLAHEINQ